MARFCIFGFLLVCIISLGRAEHVQVFDQVGFKGLLKESFGALGCERVPFDAGLTYIDLSLKTDSCLILYEKDDCTSPSTATGHKYSTQVKAGDYTNMRSAIPWGDRIFRSYGGCSKPDEPLKVDLYSAENRLGSSRLGTYEDVCGCVSLPMHIVNKQIKSVDNHNQCVRLYTSVNCGSGLVSLKEGVSVASENLAGNIMSLQSCNTLPSCVSFKPEVIKLTMTGKLPLLETNTTNFIDKLNEPTLYRNNASVVATEEYVKNNLEVDEVVVVTMPAFSNLEDFSHHPLMEIETNADFPVFARSRIGDVLKAAYDKPPTTPKGPKGPYVGRPKTSFTIKQTIEVPACTLYKVSSHVAQLKNYEVDYKVTVRLTGTMKLNNPIPMTTAEIKKYLPGTNLTFVEDSGSDAIIAEVSSKLVATVAVEAVIDDEQEEIENCDYGGASWIGAALPVILVSVLAHFYLV